MRAVRACYGRGDPVTRRPWAALEPAHGRNHNVGMTIDDDPDAVRRATRVVPLIA